MKQLFTISLALIVASSAVAHQGHSHQISPLMKRRIKQLNTDPGVKLAVMQRREVVASAPRPEMAKYFDAFKDSVKVRWDTRFLLVESNGMPDHPALSTIRTANSDRPFVTQ